MKSLLKYCGCAAILLLILLPLLIGREVAEARRAPSMGAFSAPVDFQVKGPDGRMYRFQSPANARLFIVRRNDKGNHSVNWMWRIAHGI